MVRGGMKTLSGLMNLEVVDLNKFSDLQSPSHTSPSLDTELKK